MNHQFIFKFLRMPPINSELRRAISKVNAKWSGLTLQGAGDYELLCDLHLALVNAIGIANIEVTSIRVIPDGDEDEAAPRAIGLTDLSQESKDIVVFSMMAATVAADMLAQICQCSREEAAKQIQLLTGEKFGEMSNEEVSQALEKVEEQERTKTDSKIVFVKI